MFFCISTVQHQPSQYLSEENAVGNFFLQTDKGWKRHDNIFYKGYCLEGRLSEKVKNKDFVSVKGNYAIIDLDDPAIYYDDCRSFPIFHNESILTNIATENTQQVWLDSDVFYRNGWSSVFNSNKNIKFDPSKQLYSFDYMVDFVCDYMAKCVQNLDVELPIYVANSNGVDSTIVRSALDYVGKTYKLVESTKDTEELWGYRQLHYSSTPHIQATGYCGDEILLRNPQYVQWLLEPYGIDLAQEYDKHKHTYMLGFFNKNYREKIKKSTYDCSTRQKSFDHVKSWVSNDYQMWHIDDVLTFTPFRNKDLIEIQMYADTDALIRQCVHADLSKEIIKKLNPKNLQFLSANKNDVLPD